jgi:hypothetical protein
MAPDVRDMILATSWVDDGCDHGKRLAAVGHPEDFAKSGSW